MSCWHGHDCGCGRPGPRDSRFEADSQGWWYPRGSPRRSFLALRPDATAASLEAYLEELRAEAHEVDERLHALRRAEAGHSPRRTQMPGGPPPPVSDTAADPEAVERR